MRNQLDIDLSRSRQIPEYEDGQYRVQYRNDNKGFYPYMSVQGPQQHEINRSRVKEHDNFPYGKQSIKIANYVARQMSKDEQNKLILEKFRRDAIRNRNQKLQRHVGVTPYITQSMLGGIGVDNNQFMERPRPQPIKVYHRPTVPVYRPPPPQRYRTLQPSPEKYPSQQQSIGIQVDFERQFPLKKLKKRAKKMKQKQQDYTIQQFKEQLAFSKIQGMLENINTKLKMNTQLIKQNLKQERDKSPHAQNNQFIKKNASMSFKLPRLYEQQITKRQFPSIQYTTKMRVKSEKQPNEINRMSIKDHLRLLKKNKKRMQDLDEYIYQY